MKKNRMTVGRSCLLLTMTFSMFACEKKPSHTQAENALKQQLPTFLSLKSSKSEFIPSNKTRGVIQIKAELELNEDLFKGAERALTPNSYGDQLLNGQIQTLNDLISKCRNKRLSVPDTKTKAYNKAEVDLEHALNSSTRTVLTKVTPKSTGFSYNGKANASLEMEEWKISSFTGAPLNVAGSPRSIFPGNALLDGDPQLEKLEKDYEELAKACGQARADLIQELEKTLQAHEDSIMNPVREALKVGKTWSDYSTYSGEKVPLKWTVTKFDIFGTSDDSKVGSVTFSVESGDVTGFFSGDVYRRDGELNIHVRIGEKPAIPKEAPDILPFIFSPQNGTHLTLRDGRLKKTNWGWKFEAECAR